ncbi:DNA-binding transcriptional activator of the SARP family [Thermomonospora echinospora]|uniref:DNA-binding transcriptional activator of the SARP family n=1 Tax=Thermomonospora echinospora TaxID=1992 RepID=A0A1H6DWC0_9ACTN|nr:BTAD domain-containing putative transcriptional regulator [Thermomonospora echinospora]SEG89642.1 DNA-binding transcriptional activator of the SARP family [Thermomonospora echinospora]
MGDDLRFEILGPLRAWRGDQRLDLGPGKQRAVLAVLLLNVGRPVSTEAIIDAVWPRTPPENGPNVVQKYVAGLRRVLEPGRSPRTPGRLPALTEAGYVLDCPPRGLDAEVFRARVARARRLGTTGGAEMRAALELWRGEALGGLRGPLFDSARRRLAEERAAAFEAYAEMEVAAGEHAGLVPELVRMVDEFPLREELHYWLILALYRSGRQAEALIAYRDARERLVEELGIEPGERLRELHLGILRGDPSLSAPARPPFPAPPTPPPSSEPAQTSPARSVSPGRAGASPAPPAEPVESPTARPSRLGPAEVSPSSSGLMDASAASLPSSGPADDPAVRPPPLGQVGTSPSFSGPVDASAVPSSSSGSVDGLAGRPASPGAKEGSAVSPSSPDPAESSAMRPVPPGRVEDSSSDAVEGRAARPSSLGPVGAPHVQPLPDHPQTLPTPPGATTIPMGPMGPLVFGAPVVPRAPRRSWLPLLAAIMVPLATFGTGTWALFAYLAGRRHSRALALAAGGYFALTSFLLAVMMGTDAETLTPLDGLAISALLVTMFGGVVHGAGVASAPSTVPPESVRRIRREQARALADHYPEIAVRLGIGRPDLSRLYDDGGLVDVNAAPEHVLAALPGVTLEQARLIALDRDRHGPFASPTDVVTRGLLPAPIVASLHGVLIAVRPVPPPAR